MDDRITATIILDSVSPKGARIVTAKWTFPRFILAECNTHRLFSRNAASSRAIPSARLISIVEDSPFVPIAFTRNQRGMQGGALEETADEEARRIWLEASRSMAGYAKQLSELQVHKQHANRLLEPFLYTTYLVTATEWDNFFLQRASEHAQPEFAELAYKMLAALNESEPVRRTEHIPFGDQMPEDLDNLPKYKVAVARCARVSYDNFDGTRNIERDLDLYERLSNDRHLSPLEHVAFAFFEDPYKRSDNFVGWMSYRKRYFGTFPKDERIIRRGVA